MLGESHDQEVLSLSEIGTRIDDLISDVLMPLGMSGIDLAGKLGMDRPGIPLLLTSGYAGAFYRDDHRFPLLPTPYSVLELVWRVKIKSEAGGN